jgi:hypothetical protein
VSKDAGFKHTDFERFQRLRAEALPGAARRCQEKRPKVRHSEIMCWGHAHALQNQGVFKKLQRMQGGEEFETEVPNDSEEVLCEFEEALEGM